MKLLVDAPSGRKELIEIDEGGGYFDESRILWDERSGKPMNAQQKAWAQEAAQPVEAPKEVSDIDRKLAAITKAVLTGDKTELQAITGK